jgi:Ca-activated chloride channel family protein
MSFANPAFLVLLLLVPPVLWLWHRRGQGALRYSNSQVLTGLPQGRSRRARSWGIGLRGAGLVFLIMALAGPRWPDPSSRLPTEGIAIAMVVDVSFSMSEGDLLWNNQALSRLEGVKKIFRLFVAGGEGPDGSKLEPRPHDLISLVTFATHPDTACPLTLDHDALLKILDAVEVRTAAGEATTNPGDAITWALGSLQKAPTRRKALIFLTDGESNVPPPALTPRQAAQLAGNLGVPIYAIDVGNEVQNAVGEKTDSPPLGKGEPAGTIQAKKSLEEIARLSEGKYFRAQDGNALAEAIAHIDRLERDRIESFQYRRYHEGFAWFALLALLSWASLHGLESTYWRKVP